MSRQNKILMVITLLCGSFITAFSETLLNNGLPTIMTEVQMPLLMRWLLPCNHSAKNTASPTSFQHQ